MSKVIKLAYKTFANDQINPARLTIKTNFEDKNFYGFDENYVKNTKGYERFKENLLKDMKLNTNSKILEIVGDSRQFP